MKRVVLTGLLTAGLFSLPLTSARAEDPPAAPKTEKSKGEAKPKADAKKAAKTGIEWKVTPVKVVIFLDGKKLGSAETLTFTEAKPGKHTIKLLNGEDETEAEIEIQKGQVVEFTFDFDNT